MTKTDLAAILSDFLFIRNRYNYQQLLQYYLSSIQIGKHFKIELQSLVGPVGDFELGQVGVITARVCNF